MHSRQTEVRHKWKCARWIHAELRAEIWNLLSPELVFVALLWFYNVLLHLNHTQIESMQIAHFVNPLLCALSSPRLPSTL